MILSESMITTNLTFCVVVVAVASAAYVCELRRRIYFFNS